MARTPFPLSTRSLPSIEMSPLFSSKNTCRSPGNSQAVKTRLTTLLNPCMTLVGGSSFGLSFFDVFFSFSAWSRLAVSVFFRSSRPTPSRA